MNNARWQMNRAGLLNFWHYTDETFQLSDGRLIFRGANGSGKSVTMQSFLPLVLDGDKHPKRLDPFGSKDRKIEYYLLGETDNSTTDRTGYLYLEFVQPQQNKYVTIGIGLRARRGVQQIGFWGFAITDQRRVGHDIFLYDRDLFETHGQKVPLDRAGLEQVVGDGGKVVREQREYRKLVNELLFGFADVEGYKELLDLLIQVRSPKLSKEFRPSTIYGILNEALSPLGDEDLRPLAEVLEDLDEISDRLEELAQHRVDAEKLHMVYQRYNEMRLFQFGQDVGQSATELRAKMRDMETEREELAHLQTQYAEFTQCMETSGAQIRAAEIEIDTLEHSEEMEQQHELEDVRVRLQEVERDIQNTDRRLRNGQSDVASKRDREYAVSKEIDDHFAQQQDFREQLRELAGEFEFSDHAVYEAQWQTGETSAATNELWASLRRDVMDYKVRLNSMRMLIQQVRQHQERMQDAERALSDARGRRDARERDVQEVTKNVQNAIVLHEDKLMAWHKGIAYLPIDSSMWQQVLRRLQKYPEVSYQDVIASIRSAHAEGQLIVRKERLRTEHEKAQLLTQRNTLQQELEEWRNQREPEPDRSSATKRARARRVESTTQGATIGGAFYTLCDFHPNVDEMTRAQIETMLHRTGLLDAWVGPLGWQPAPFEEGEEDTWIQPNPTLFGMTLAEYLKPTPTDESGLSAEQVDNVLRTVLLGDSVEPMDNLEAAGASILPTGQYHIGPLAGQVLAKARAEWIGTETRKQTRLEQIRRLETEIVWINQQMEAHDGQLAQYDAKIHALDSEMDALPHDVELKHVSDALRELNWQLEQETRAIEGLTERFKDAQRLWRDAQQKSLEQARKWVVLKTENDFDRALEQLNTYQEVATDLKASSSVCTAKESERARILKEVTLLEERIHSELEQMADYRDRKQDFLTRIAMLEELLASSGGLDIFTRLQVKKDERVTLQRTLDAARANREKCNGLLGGCQARVQQREIELAAAESKSSQAIQRFRIDVQLGLVPLLDWTSDAVGKPDETALNVEDDNASVRLAQSVVGNLKSRYESRKLENITQTLQETFALVKNSLVEYSLEQRYDEEVDRLFIESLRQKGHPMTPIVLLEELRRLEKEQRVLIDEKDRELYEQILLRSVGRAIRDKINRAEQWVHQMNQFMAERNTSSGFVLSLAWQPRAARNEQEIDTEKLVRLLRKSPETLRSDELDEMMNHFRSRIQRAKVSTDEGETLRQAIHNLLDYRGWFNFELFYKKGDQSKRPLTDARFNVLSGGEKAMAMYIPLFAATDSRFKDSRANAPRLISLDEAFAGVDEENMRDMFQLLTDMEFDYMMTSQQLWGCYDTVPSLSIYEVHRPNDGDFISLIPYYWNGERRRFGIDEGWPIIDEVAATQSTDDYE